MGRGLGRRLPLLAKNICAACSVPPDRVLALSFGGTLPNNRSLRPGPRLLVVTSALTMSAKRGYLVLLQHVVVRRFSRALSFCSGSHLASLSEGQGMEGQGDKANAPGSTPDRSWHPATRSQAGSACTPRVSFERRGNTPCFQPCRNRSCYFGVLTGHFASAATGFLEVLRGGGDSK